METNINEAAVLFMRDQGCALPDIRLALIKLAGKTEPALVEVYEVTHATVAAYICGGRTNPGALAIGYLKGTSGLLFEI